MSRVGKFCSRACEGDIMMELKEDIWFPGGYMFLAR